MVDKKAELFLNYEFFYRKLAKGPMLRVEMVDYLINELGKSRTSAYREVKELVDDEDGMLTTEEDLILLDEEKFYPFIEGFCEIYFKRRLDEFNKCIERLESQVKTISKAYIEDLEQQQVIIKESITYDDPSINYTDEFLIPWGGEYTDYEMEVMKNQSEWTRESFFKELEDANLEENPDGCVELNRDNNMIRGFIKTATEKLFKSRAKDTKTYKEMVEKSNNKEAVDNVVNKRKQAAAIEIASLKDLSNQEKLALYACMGRYKNQEMESLLNLAGNKCINADFLIAILENGEEINNYENMRDFIRQMAKPSSVNLKQEFAEELIKGHWYVTCNCNGKDKKYQLMPVDEYNLIRNIVLGEPEEIEEEPEHVKSELEVFLGR